MLWLNYAFGVPCSFWDDYVANVVLHSRNCNKSTVVFLQLSTVNHVHAVRNGVHHVRNVDCLRTWFAKFICSAR